MSSKIDIQKRCKWCNAVFTAHNGKNGKTAPLKTDEGDPWKTVQTVPRKTEEIDHLKTLQIAPPS